MNKDIPSDIIWLVELNGTVLGQLKPPIVVINNTLEITLYAGENNNEYLDEVDAIIGLAAYDARYVQSFLLGKFQGHFKRFRWIESKCFRLEPSGYITYQATMEYANPELTLVDGRAYLMDLLPIR